jgi:hypothetical protein
MSIRLSIAWLLISRRGSWILLELRKGKVLVSTRLILVEMEVQRVGSAVKRYDAWGRTWRSPVESGKVW